MDEVKISSIIAVIIGNALGTLYRGALFAIAFYIVFSATDAFGGSLKHEFRLVPLPDRNPVRIVQGVSSHEKTNAPILDIDIFPIAK